MHRSPRAWPFEEEETFFYAFHAGHRHSIMIKLFSLKQAKKDGESPKPGTQKKASAAQLRITKGFIDNPLIAFLPVYFVRLTLLSFLNAQTVTHKSCSRYAYGNIARFSYPQRCNLHISIQSIYCFSTLTCAMTRTMLYI